MKIQNLAVQSPAFGRALCRSEEQGLKNLTKEALQKLGISNVSTTIFDFAVPSGFCNTGIGTMFSEEGIDTAEFANTYFGATNIQVGPQGQISNFIRSPYSGTTFALGMHNISPERLTTKEYGKLLSQKDISESPYILHDEDSDTVDYDHVFNEEEGIRPLLLKAYQKFKKLPENSELKAEYNRFVTDNKDWLERDSIFEAIAYKQGTDISKWNDEKAKNLYADENNIDKKVIKKYKATFDDEGNNIFEFNEFVQFIADKQQKQTKRELNAKGISITGDSQIGFSDREVWAYKSAFYNDGRMYGCDKDGDGKFITCWTPAPDMSKLDGEAGKLFRQKFAMQFKRYNAIRIDAAWQLIAPTIVKSTGHKDEYGNMIGTLRGLEDQQPYLGTKIVDILKDEARKAGVSEDKISLELLDGAGKSYKALADSNVKTAIKDMYCIHTMQHMKGDWGYPGRYRNVNDPFKHPFEISIGTHDDRTAREFAENINSEQIDIMSRELKKDKGFFSDVPNKLSGLFAMLFTNTPNNNSQSPGKVSITINDAVGSAKRINVPNTQANNWEYRLGKNWKEDYFENLSYNRFGFNLPKALSTALKAKEGDSALTEKLDKYANTLESDGPMTRVEAEAMARNGALDTIA